MTAIECPVSGTMVEIAVEIGATVNAGDTLLVLSAMKMETAVTAPVAGVVTGIGAAQRGRRASWQDKCS